MKAELRVQEVPSEMVVWVCLCIWHSVSSYGLDLPRVYLVLDVDVDLWFWVYALFLNLML